jgi:glycosyltransferase involved in cell wall biosynthesis
VSTAPQFSICIPTYNRAHLLPAALESAVEQTFQDFEIVVVDNASNDDTQAILERYDDSRIRVFRNKRTVSMYANHNICVQHAKAPWIVFLHSDDQLEKNALMAIRNAIRNYSCDVVYPAKEMHREALREGYIHFPGRAAIPSLLRWPAGTPSGAACKTTILKEVGFNEQTVASDLLFLSKVLFLDYSIIVLDESLVKIGVSAHQYSSEWHASGGFIVDVSNVFSHVTAQPKVFGQLLAEVKEWSDSEVAFLLMMLAHSGKIQFIDEIELKLKPRLGYKKVRHYRHVKALRFLGLTGLRGLFQLTKRFRSMWLNGLVKGMRCPTLRVL